MLLVSAVACVRFANKNFRMKTRLCNVLETTNAMTLIKAILVLIKFCKYGENICPRIVRKLFMGRLFKFKLLMSKL